MSFGNNVQYYRAKHGITQEELADRLSVTRQTVSRWETDGAFPEMEKLIALCDMFGCDMELLVRGDAPAADKASGQNNLAAYNRHMNIFSGVITGGVFTVITGVAIMLLLQAFGVSEGACVALLLSLVTVAAVLFVCGGITHNNFMRENPKAAEYPPERVKKYRAIFPFLIGGGIALILIGVIIIVVLSYESASAHGFTEDGWACFYTSLMLFCVALGAPLFVFSGMQMSKYDGKDYNRESAAAGFSGSGEAKKPRKIADTVCAVIMLVATGIFLLCGFLGNLWHPAWVVFPIGGILCAVFNIIFSAIEKK